MVQAWLCLQRNCQAAGNRVTRGARTHPSSSSGMERCACLPSGAVEWKRCAAVSWHCRSHTCISVMETCLSIAQSVQFNSFNKITACAVVLLQASAAASIADARHACVFFPEWVDVNKAYLGTSTALRLCQRCRCQHWSPPRTPTPSGRVSLPAHGQHLAVCLLPAAPSEAYASCSGL